MHYTKPTCKSNHERKSIVLRNQIAANGAVQVAWFCVECNDWAESAHWLRHDEANAILKQFGKTYNDLPVVTDYRLAVEPCVVCGEPGTEINHWMPQTLADDPEIKPEWDRWAQLNAPLCVTHHRLWHRKVTPWMPGIGRNGKHD